jgi:geranylgeranyl diphosphate synthase, type I
MSSSAADRAGRALGGERGQATTTAAGNGRAIRSAGEVLAWSRALVEPALRDAVDTLPASIRTIAGYHFGWWDEHGRPTGTPAGKAIRPTLVLLTTAAVGGSPAAAVPAAVGVELVHNFSLLHDDVMDGDVTRRHRPTAWRVFGASAAILAGDALVTLAFDVLAQTRHPAATAGLRTLSAAVLALVEGQSADVSFENRDDVGLDECVDMATGKTAALLGCACALGGSFGEADADRVAHIRQFGQSLGLAFQFVDDLLGIWGDAAVTGKPAYSDLSSRKKSLPVVAALASGTPAGRELARLYHGHAPMTREQLTRTAELIESAGGRAWSRRRADELLGAALEQLDRAAPEPLPAAELRELAKLVLRRDH